AAISPPDRPLLAERLPGRGEPQPRPRRSARVDNHPIPRRYSLREKPGILILNLLLGEDRQVPQVVEGPHFVRRDPGGMEPLAIERDRIHAIHDKLAQSAVPVFLDLFGRQKRPSLRLGQQREDLTSESGPPDS